eukprot:scaffold7773_cov110-Isochrysis_galbana.AAC.7
MAPRQLRLEPTEVNPTADKGAKRVRVDSKDESSSQLTVRIYHCAVEHLELLCCQLFTWFTWVFVCRVVPIMYLESDVEACQGLHVRERDGLLAETGDRDSYFEIFRCPFDVGKNEGSVVETITMR